MRKTIVKLADAKSLPLWRGPVALLFLMAMAQPVSFATWSALLNNWVIHADHFTGQDIGWLHTVREIPGFLAIGVIAILMFVREQVLATIALGLLGVATALTAQFPSMGGILMITLLSSIGFHYYETVNQSLQLQWIDRKRAPQMLGWVSAAASGATIAAYLLIVLTWKRFDLSYNFVYMVAGGFTVLVAIFCFFRYPQFESPHPQLKTMVFRRRYWLYYLLQLMAGARRQIFTVFAGFMMVEKFGFAVDQVTALFLINLLANMALAPLMGRAVHVFGERATLLFEYGGLFIVFVMYGGVYFYGFSVWVAAVLYVVDNIFFGLSFALKTYLQKIGDPGDMAPTAAVAFTINHIAAVVLPVTLGYVWLISPGAVFWLAAGIAAISFCLVMLIPRHPGPGQETILQGGPMGLPAE
ncbi:MFS transporter [Limimaricola sp.]|uniref:MFS transporter n=1 Tax=Limimaricola sp. TaxID=2211665 RepID=UPI0025B7EE20|nr:MFS transporter [Limimaricola sp.]